MPSSHPFPLHTLSLLRRAYSASPILFSSLSAFLLSNLFTRASCRYRLYLSLGGGGPLPHNFFGWLIHDLLLAPISLNSFWRTNGTYLPSNRAAVCGYLKGSAFKQREGKRPRTEGLAPHRQVDQLDENGNDEALKAFLMDLATSHPSHLLASSSRLEPSSLALFSLTHTLVTQSTKPSRSTRSAAFPSPLSRLFLSSLPRGELCHVHSPLTDAMARKQDGSLHLVLHPDDSNEVIIKGWGELHGLAGWPAYSGFWVGWPAWMARWRGGGRWWWSASTWAASQGANEEAERAQLGGSKIGLPPTYTLVYAPRNETEVQTIKRIVTASVAFATGLQTV